MDSSMENGTSISHQNDTNASLRSGVQTAIDEVDSENTDDVHSNRLNGHTINGTQSKLTYKPNGEWSAPNGNTNSSSHQNFETVKKTINTEESDDNDEMQLTKLKRMQSSGLAPMSESEQIKAFIAEQPYLQFWEKLQHAWSDCPDVFIRYENLQYTIPIPVHSHKIETLVSSFGTAFNSVFRPQKYDFMALAPSSGLIRPSSMTLVLAPPGHGKSTFLKALSGRMLNDKNFKGTLMYNNTDASEAARRGVFLHRLCGYVAQGDQHFPVLTTRETFDFAARNAVPDPKLFGNDELTSLDAKRSDMLMAFLGLDECAETVIGNDLVRGVSGGQRRRVTIGEMLISNARCFLLDEPSTGLDASVTYRIFALLRAWARITHGSIVTSLLQPTPETYGLFDDVILMREGYVVYHGPRSEVRQWVEKAAGVSIPSDVEEAGFLVDFLDDPLKTISKSKQENIRDARHAANGNGLSTTASESVDGKVGSPVSGPAITTDAMLQNYHHSHVYQQLSAELEESKKIPELDPSTWMPYTKAQFCQPYPHSFMRHLKDNTIRQAKVIGRNRTMLRPRLFQATISGVIYGTLFFQLPFDDYESMFGLLLYCVMYGAFANLTEIPVSTEARGIVFKQLEAGFYPTGSYTIAVITILAPVILTESIIFGVQMYFMPHLDYNAARFFWFLFILFSASSALSVFFRSLSYIASNPDVARQLDLPFIVIFIIFGGFLITYDLVPNWLIWAYWLSPFSWAVRSLAINQFDAHKYSKLISTDTYPVGPGDVNSNPTGKGSGAITGPTHLMTEGDIFLTSFGFFTGKVWKWVAIAYLWGFFVLFAVVCTIFLRSIRPPTPIGTRRVDAKEFDDDDLLHDGNAQQVSIEFVQPKASTDGMASTKNGTISNVPASPATAPIPSMDRNLSFHMSTLPFTPATMSWRNIHYTVFLGKKHEPRLLLNNISGFVLPGQLVALMGASGAGKTTLIDVISMRKTIGKIEGEILINGFPQDAKTFPKISGYVEQADLHIGTATVREALLFSARLRLPERVLKETREKFVDEVMELIGLSKLRDRVIGDAALVGLSPGQLKLVTIGVELVTNPSILFLDEPTSGLSAPAAYQVMKAVRRIAATGRSVVCTIHQPSADVFYMFDRLLLLQPGGKTVYFGDTGKKGSEMVRYFEELGGADGPHCPKGINPANWMLDVVAGIAPSRRNREALPADPDKGPIDKFDYAAAWSESPLNRIANEQCERASTPEKGATSYALEERYASWLTRYLWVQRRYFISHWRAPAFNLTRFLLMVTIAILLGLIYLSMSIDNFQGLNNFMAVVFLGISFPSSIAASSALSTLFRQRAVYYRETTAGCYGYLIFSLGVTIVEIPYIAVAVMLFLVPYYWMVGLAPSALLFFEFYSVSMLMAILYSFLVQLWLALVPNLIAANILNGLFMGLFFLFGGLFIKASAISNGWKWFYYVDPVPKAYCAVIMRQIEARNYPITVPGSSGTTSSYDYASSVLECHASEYPMWCGYLVLSIACIRVLNLLALRFISHLKR